MSSAVVLQHVPYAGPGRITSIFGDFGIPVEIRRLYQGDEVPTDLEEIRILIILGGPMGVKDIGDSKYPYLAQEVELLKRLIHVDRPVLGIALGAQLLAHAGGAKVYPLTRPGAKPEDPPVPTPELGWVPVTFPFPGGTEPIVLGMMDGAPMFEWHFDAFDLPKLPPPPGAPPHAATGSALLSSSKLCKNQAFRFKNRLFGFMYHIECTQPEIEGIVAAGRPEALKWVGADADTKIRQEMSKVYDRYDRLCARLLGNVVQFLKLY
jgi:GMP synthase (glutamine-hydrolysing)